MGNEVPPILWYLLWAFVLTVLPIVLSLLDHRRRMKRLEILKSYAEKGIEPPASVAEALAQEGRGSPGTRGANRSARDARFGGFIGFTFMACVLGGIAWALIHTNGPSVAIYALIAGTIFFGAGGCGFLLVALFTS